ncbi:MOSC domain-containing protein [Roseivirga sp. BDSF3-8]|uniref:MOSC domain-containing protein n=1 Tax=Roseivirga sp. BDSF3-8 TaxID=3241598 RepID=UPI003531A88E
MDNSTPFITDLYIYPVKSLGGIRLKKSEVTPRGLAYDRRWMLVDRSGLFMSQRKTPRMALIKLRQTEEGFEAYLDSGELAPFKIPYLPETNELVPVKVQVWDDEVQARRVGKEADEWFTQVLGLRCSLVYMPDSSNRLVETAYAKSGEQVSFADGYPYLIIGQASLDDLNSRMEEALPMDRFRPNIVFGGTEPFAEDRWKHFKINGILFHAAKPCARCVLTTVNQKTAEKGPEPLTTLATYRRKDNKILFGQNLLHRGDGELKVGDTITVSEYKEAEL